MAKMVCSEFSEGGLNLNGIFLALLIALILMALCSPPPRRAIVVARRIH
ncbi:hypothetical protein SLEP1_g23265 [Rubroshorea leprosula]|uniref:Uncharacterized protein n=1 Tax=Rubroshorea leprosula TaxID=152421 RepID=A0AAV5JL50_9ROSI|nr:hypothetical protein SLEP1_g23265 [Rubroshorea leprosula]